jgi:hypothetical protein
VQLVSTAKVVKRPRQTLRFPYLCNLGANLRFGSNAPMIETTTRLSRGGRLRRGQPLWPYGLIISGLALVGLLVLLKH